MLRFIAVLIVLLSNPTSMLAKNSSVPPACEIILDDFRDGIKAAWISKSFNGLTKYTWTKENDRAFIKAKSKGSASGLYYKVDYDAGEYPYITWQWKVDNIIAAGDATKKSADDYGARVYVVFPAFYFWNTRTINYIWANHLPKGLALPSPYTSNNMMVSVESGPSETGRWLTETRNVYEDFRRLFGEEPPKVGAIAIMTDTDDTGESASAGYGPIAICSRDPGK